MQGQANQHSAPEHDDERLQRAVLGLVLYQHPAHLSSDEIAREVDPGDTDQAVRELVAVGLLRREGTSVLPTRAALHFDQLAA